MQQKTVKPKQYFIFAKDKLDKKNRKELPKQGNLGVFFKHFFKRIITTVLAATNIACSFSSPSLGRLVCVHSVLLKNFSS